MELTPRHGVAAGLLALLPVAAFVLAQGEQWAGIALVNVLLIVGSLYVAFSPVENGGHDAPA